jgi:hypothetical protein
MLCVLPELSKKIFRHLFPGKLFTTGGNLRKKIDFCGKNQ